MEWKGLEKSDIYKSAFMSKPKWGKIEVDVIVIDCK